MKVDLSGSNAFRGVALLLVAVSLGLLSGSASGEDKFRKSYKAEFISIAPSPELPPDLEPWPIPEVLYSCKLATVGESEYNILEAIAFHRQSAWRKLPGYILEGVRINNNIDKRRAQINDVSPDPHGVSHVLRYISYRDMTQLVLLLNRDAKRKHGNFRRYQWVEEISGIQFDRRGTPLRDGRGKYNFRRISSWMKKQDLKRPTTFSVKTLSDSLIQGLYNSDPRVRLQCLSILRAMGPTPYVQDAIRHAGGLVEGGLETVGNVKRGYFASAAIHSWEKEKYKKNDFPEGSGELMTRRYVFCDIDGRPHWRVPHYEFSSMDRRIERLKLAFNIEVTGDLDADAMSTIEPDRFLTLTDSLVIQGAYGVNRSTRYGEAPHIDTDTGRLHEGERFYNGFQSEADNLQALRAIPARQYVGKKSYFRTHAPKVLYPFSPPVLPDVDPSMTTPEMSRVLRAMFGALENRNFLVRRRAASFLRDLYRTESLDLANHKKILNATLYSTLLREFMKAEFIPRVRVSRLHEFLAYDDFNQIRGDMVSYDREYGDLFLKPYNSRPTVIHPEVPIPSLHEKSGLPIGFSHAISSRPIPTDIPVDKSKVERELTDEELLAAEIEKNYQF